MTKSVQIRLVPISRERALADVEKLPPEHRAQVSDQWLRRVQEADRDNVWLFGFAIVDEATQMEVGSCGFKAPPDDGVVEIAYGVHPEFERQGFATAAAAAMVAWASRQGNVRQVIAHTLSPDGASAAVLRKSGFTSAGTVEDPEDGQVWRWEQPAAISLESNR